MGESQPVWAPVYTFTGLETHYPVELFIATVEHQHRGPKRQLREERWFNFEFGGVFL